ncbi:MAG: hypothetical protein CVU09_00495 [Bacteroidetes bacterium HGW-Bacteroidetes-4]|nr:MAG: hypothetical protein CVU09_00495 [Bacteroidetes bacterium HGW-Bacteroidetes-4]
MNIKPFTTFTYSLHFYMIYTIGEIVLDIIIKNLDEAQIKPGGSMLNTAISLGRLKVPVNHISVLSRDKAAELLIDFLHRNAVGSQYIYREAGIKTNLALAFLDAQNNAQYSFYKDKAKQTPPLLFPKVKVNDMIHFGSFFGLNPLWHPQLDAFLSRVNSLNGIVMYDPNFRTPHLHQLPELFPLIEKNIAHASIVKGSNDDFKNIYGITNGQATWNMIKKLGPTILIYTKGNQGVELFTDAFQLSLEAKKIKTISTVGAGDTFSAGILFRLYQHLSREKELMHLDKTAWAQILETATLFASETCQSYDNYLSASFANNFLHVQ